MFEVLFKKCSHSKIGMYQKSGYCPDCGEYVENHWYITRCKCCGVKHKSLIRNGHVVPVEHFCKNCGESSYIVEEIDFPDIVTINYAAVLRTEHKRFEIPNVIQMWTDKANTMEEVKLLSAC